ncbi:MAG: hypothetical protein K8W52_46395 [Deltaproteobacteria bacterium]|nr:hypothetical protein [Deltaproteobacteria bacterium]
MTFFACMCNQPQHLARALAPARAALVASGPIARWGLGSHQGGEVLLARTPKPAADVDMYAAIGEISSDCVIGQAIAEADAGGVGGNDNTPPFRFRRWMYAQAARHPAPGDAWPGLGAAVETLPEFVRRNMRGRTAAEAAFHVMLAMLHDQGGLDDPNVPLATTRDVFAASQTLLRAALTKAGATGVLGNAAVSNGRTMLVARAVDGDPLWLRRLSIQGEKTARDEAFRGVLLVSRAASLAEGFEEVPAGSVVMVARDLRVDIAPMPA